MWQAVAFDLDGTLIDSTDAIVESFLHTFRTIGEPPPPAQAIVESIGHVLEDQFALLTRHDPTECARIYREHYGAVCCEKTTLMPGGHEALESLADAGFKLGFVTSKRRRYAEQILDHLEVLHYFSVRIGPDDVARPKPHPDALHLALQQFGVAAPSMLLIGDTEFDVLAARAAGVACYCVTTGYATAQELEALHPDGIFASLADIANRILHPRVQPSGVFPG